MTSTAVDFAWLRNQTAHATATYLRYRENEHDTTRSKAAWAFEDVLETIRTGLGMYWIKECRREMAEYARQVAVERAELRIIRDILAAKEAA